MDLRSSLQLSFVKMSVRRGERELNNVLLISQCLSVRHGSVSSPSLPISPPRHRNNNTIRYNHQTKPNNSASLAHLT